MAEILKFPQKQLSGIYFIDAPLGYILKLIDCGCDECRREFEILKKGNRND